MERGWNLFWKTIEWISLVQFLKRLGICGHLVCWCDNKRSEFIATSAEKWAAGQPLTQAQTPTVALGLNPTIILILSIWFLPIRLNELPHLTSLSSPLTPDLLPFPSARGSQSVEKLCQWLRMTVVDCLIEKKTNENKNSWYVEKQDEVTRSLERS